MEQTTQRPSHWTLGWPWIPLAATTENMHLPVRGEIGLRDLHFWAATHVRMVETACATFRDAVREAMRTFCLERRAEHLLQPLLQPLPRQEAV